MLLCCAYMQYVHLDRRQFARLLFTISHVTHTHDLHTQKPMMPFFFHNLFLFNCYFVFRLSSQQLIKRHIYKSNNKCLLFRLDFICISSFFSVFVFFFLLLSHSVHLLDGNIQMNTKMNE